MSSSLGLLAPDDLMALVESGRELAGDIAIESLLQRILTRACELTDSPDSSVILHNEHRGSLYFAAATGDNAAMVLERWGETAEQQIPIEGSVAGEVFTDGKSQVVHAVAGDDGHYKGVDSDTRKATQSMVCVPLRLGDSCLGAMQLLNKRGGDYSDRDRVLLEHFADQAAVAIRNARLFGDLLAHMGLYAPPEDGKGPLDLMAELERPAHTETLTIMFPDMRGFTQLCQMLSNPATMQQWLNEFVTMLAEEVLAHGGTVNKFLGDGLLALFRGPGHAERGVRCAFAMVERFAALKARWDEQTNILLDFLDIGIGMATDNVVVGTIGHRRVRDFTVIGNAVNLAANFERDARDGRRILVDQMTYNAAREIVEEIEGPEDYELRHPGQTVGQPYKRYHLKRMARPVRARLFISHSHQDRAYIEEHLIAPLANYEIATWYSRDDIPKGAAWVRAIREGLASCEWVVVVVSRNSAGSRWVSREIDLAMADSRLDDRIIPVVLDDTKLEDVNEWLVPLNGIFVNDEDKPLAQVIRDRVLAASGAGST